MEIRFSQPQDFLTVEIHGFPRATAREKKELINRLRGGDDGGKELSAVS